MTLRSAIGRIAAYAAAFVAASTVHLTAHGALLYAFDDFFFASPAPTQTVAHTSASAIAFTGAAYFCTSFNGNPGGSCGGYGNDASTFTITPDPGYALNITGFSFDERNVDQFGPTRFDVFTSLDGFTRSLLSGALSPSATSFTHWSVALSIDDVAEPFTVRIVPSGLVGLPASQWRLDNVRLDVAAVPFVPPVPVSAPAGWALVVAALAGLGATRRLGRVRPLSRPNRFLPLECTGSR